MAASSRCIVAAAAILVATAAGCCLALHEGSRNTTPPLRVLATSGDGRNAPSGQCILLGWGRNDASELLQPDSACPDGCHTPVLMSALGGLNPNRIRSIQGGATASEVGIAVTFEGTVWGWGYNFQDVFGLPGGATNTVRSPVQLPIPCNVKRAMVGMSGDQVPNQSVLEAQMVVLCSDGKTVLATSWYPNRRGGRGGSPTAFLPVPHSIRGGIVSLAVGAAHTLLLAADGTVWSFGENDSGQLGRTTLNPEGGDSNVVQVPDIPDKVVRVAAGESHSIVVTASGDVYTFGANQEGELCRKEEVFVGPGLIDGPRGMFKDACSSEDYTLLLAKNGDVWFCGEDTFGQRGGGPWDGVYPTLILKGQRVSQLACGESHITVSTAWGAVFGWGLNDWGQAGQSPQRSQPVDKVTLPAWTLQQGFKVADVGAGYLHSYALMCQSGAGSRSQSPSPTPDKGRGGGTGPSPSNSPWAQPEGAGGASPSRSPSRSLSHSPSRGGSVTTSRSMSRSGSVTKSAPLTRPPLLSRLPSAVPVSSTVVSTSSPATTPSRSGSVSVSPAAAVTVSAARSAKVTFVGSTTASVSTTPAGSTPTSTSSAPIPSQAPGSSMSVTSSVTRTAAVSGGNGGSGTATSALPQLPSAAAQGSSKTSAAVLVVALVSVGGVVVGAAVWTVGVRRRTSSCNTSKEAKDLEGSSALWPHVQQQQQSAVQPGHAQTSVVYDGGVSVSMKPAPFSSSVTGSADGASSTSTTNSGSSASVVVMVEQSVAGAASASPLGAGTDDNTVTVTADAVFPFAASHSDSTMSCPIGDGVSKIPAPSRAVHHDADLDASDSSEDDGWSSSSSTSSGSEDEEWTSGRGSERPRRSRRQAVFVHYFAPDASSSSSPRAVPFPGAGRVDHPPPFGWQPRGVKQPRTRWMAGGGSPRASSPRRPLASNIPTDDVGTAGPCSPQPKLALGPVHGSPVVALVARASISPRARLHGPLSRAGSVGETAARPASRSPRNGGHMRTSPLARSIVTAAVSQGEPLEQALDSMFHMGAAAEEVDPWAFVQAPGVVASQAVGSRLPTSHGGARAGPPLMINSQGLNPWGSPGSHSLASAWLI